MSRISINNIIGNLYNIAESMELGVLIINNLGTIIKCSKNIETVLQMNELVGKNWDTIKSKGRVCANYQKDGIRFYRIRFNNETVLIKELNVGTAECARIQFWLNNEKPSRMMNELQNLTEENKMLKAMMEFQGIIVCDLQGRIIYINEEAAKRVGVNAKSVMLQKVQDLNPECQMESVAQTGVPKLGKIMYLNGSYVPVMLFPLFIDGKIEGTVARSVFTDINEAKNYIKIIRDALKAHTDIDFNKNQSNDAKYNFDNIIGVSKEICFAKELALQAAQSDASVLLLGETGTGKELFAHAIHSASLRSNMPFVRVNCASIPETLLESELFGYETGSFTGAKKGGKPGKFEIADKGTLFLDEIGDMNLNMQSKLLRVLQEGEIEKIGKSESVKVDVRIIAATNRNLAEMVRNGLFREDLYYRLDVIRIDIPPLRHRKADIEPITKHLNTKISAKYGKNIIKISQDVLDLFNKYFWPGNVRELANVIEGTVCLLQGNIIDIESLPSNFLKRYFDTRPPICNMTQYNSGVGQRRVILDDELEEERIKKALEITSGNKRQAAIVLGVARSTFYEKLKKYGIKYG
ncbi:MAG: sigma 54-interacting transcriptional regulator [Syntrophomonadaceae bacterium]|nr:sigma 54-interacting transcriptional regulator [Syntrophomonadaceae bacterium]